MKNTLFNIIVFLAICLFVSSADAGETCGCDISATRVSEYDLALQKADPVAAKQRHAPWGMPIEMTADANTRPLFQRHWITGYDPDLLIPRWVSYRLEAHELAQPRRRTQCFRPDMRASGPRCLSYRGSGFDRGHMVPSADMTRSEQAMVNSYVLTNIAPQHPNFNRGIWRILEQRVRKMARKHGTIYVLSGAIFDRDHDGVPDPDAKAHRARSRQGMPRVAVASHFYKVIAVPSETSYHFHAWLLDHSNVSSRGVDMDKALRRARVSLARIEQLSGLDIFPLLSQDVEQAQAR